MATASQGEVQKIVQQRVTEKVIHLTLTPEEAETLVIISARIGGMPHTTRRGDVDAIRDALEMAGITVPFNYEHENIDTSGLNCTIYFTARTK